METVLTFKTLQEASRTRQHRWHDQDDQWTPLEWAGAMCGEAGEAANAAKKLRRLQGKIKNLDKRGIPHGTTVAKQEELYKVSIAGEVADTILYGICLLNAIGIDAETVIRAIFNQKSEEYDFPERV